MSYWLFHTYYYSLSSDDSFLREVTMAATMGKTNHLLFGQNFYELLHKFNGNTFQQLFATLLTVESGQFEEWNGLIYLCEEKT